MRRSLVLVVLCLLALSACRVDTSLTIAVEDDGSGVVTARVALDAEAVKAVEGRSGVKLKNAVRLGDLTKAGWKSSGWVRGENGGATLTLSKGFARADEAGNVVAELNGTDGPVRNVEVTRDATKFQTEWTFSGVADLKDLKTGLGGDAELLARLANERIDAFAIDQRLLAQTRDALRLQVVSDLPNSSGQTFAVPPGAVIVMEDSSSKNATGKMLLLLVGILLVIAAVVLLAVGGARERRRRREAQRPMRRSVGLFEDPPDPT